MDNLKIGGVTLDYSKYPGEDQYCDGEVEEALLSIARTRAPEEFAACIRERKDWPTLYHLSPARANIIEWIPMDGTEKVLEIGAGPGAMTGVLAGKARRVDCVDLSSRRSQINAYRNRDRDNILIHVGNFEDIEPSLPADYDYIFLIGVLEYAGSYIRAERPFHEELRRILSHLKPGGRLVIAIENRLGLKYFAGAREDHTGRYFDGIRSYENTDSQVRTFSRSALEGIFRELGIAEYSFYYPYPDYKFVSSIYSDRRLPGGSELTENIRNFDRDRLLLFDEKEAYDGILEDGLYPVFANSYEVVVGPALPVSYVKYSSERAPQYRIVTRFEELPEGRVVRKIPLTGEARAHVARMARMAEKLSRRYEVEGEAEGGLSVAPCRLLEDGSAEFPYVPGRTLRALLDEAWEQGDMDRFRSLVGEFVRRAGAGEEQPAADPDMTFGNIIVDGDRWTAIDYEWAEEKVVSARALLLRALTVYMAENESRKEDLLSELSASFGITEEELAEQRRVEDAFQQKVTGGILPLSAFREQLGARVIIPEEIIRDDPALLRKAGGPEGERGQQAGAAAPTLTSVQVYYDTGKGFREEEQFFLAERYAEEGCVRFTLEIPENVRHLRIDPALCPCLVYLAEILVGGRKSRAMQRLARSNGRRDPDGAFVFATDDPNLCWDLGRVRRAEKIKSGALLLTMTIQMCGMPSTMARRMRGGQ